MLSLLSSSLEIHGEGRYRNLEVNNYAGVLNMLRASGGLTTVILKVTRMRRENYLYQIMDLVWLIMI